jgi:hypothetical protein
MELLPQRDPMMLLGPFSHCSDLSPQPLKNSFLALLTMYMLVLHIQKSKYLSQVWWLMLTWEDSRLVQVKEKKKKGKKRKREVSKEPPPPHFNKHAEHGGFCHNPRYSMRLAQGEKFETLPEK